MASLLGNILKSAIPLVHELTDGTTVTLYSGSGSTFDPEDLDVATATAETTVACSSPWPYEVAGMPIEAGRMRVSIDGSLPELTIEPKAGMLARIDERTYTIIKAHHDLDADEWMLDLEGAG
jgi:hypothetical protein